MPRLKIQFKCYLLKEVFSEYASLHFSPLNFKSTLNIHTKAFPSLAQTLLFCSLQSL